MEDSFYDSELSSDESEFGSLAPGTSGAGTSGGIRSEATVAGPSQNRRAPPGARAESEAKATRLLGANVGAQARILALEGEIERLRQQHEAEVASLQSELRTRLRPEGVNPALERSYLDAVRLCRRLASLEDSNSRIGVLDPRNSHARTREQLVDYHVPSSFTGHWDR
ncbi:hypothetical protein Nepgr_025059 [Nepenthes gracilis]|uniref:Uncharacterized protein n=1 Tax=Nepenthes gracilis TaxID=150966 RepID=A0AAD3T600_NEPGR|nr:hypothetical protein Nepgr_025059 [Nepenthes gracilis]